LRRASGAAGAALIHLIARFGSATGSVDLLLANMARWAGTVPDVAFVLSA